MVQSPILGRMFGYLGRRERRTAERQWLASERSRLRVDILQLSVGKLGRRDRIVGAAHRLQQRVAIVRENLRLLLSARDRHIAGALIRRAERFARHADKYL